MPPCRQRLRLHLTHVSVIGHRWRSSVRSGPWPLPSDWPDDVSIQKIQIDSKDSSIKMFKESISGEYEFGSQIIAANAGAVFYILDLVNSLKEGAQLAYEIIKSGLAYEKLEQYIKYSNQK